MKTLFFISYLFFTLYGSNSYSQAIEPLDTTEIKIPTTLYTWVSLERFRGILEDFAKGNAILRPIDPKYHVAKTNPDLANIPARFFWTDPMTGIASSPKEIYGRGEVLMRFDLDPKKIKSVSNIEALPTQATRDVDIKKAKKGDLVYFGMYGITEQGEYYLSYQEWILLNQNIIKKISADPQELIPVLKEKLAKMDRLSKNGKPVKYPENQIHNVKANLPNQQKDFLREIIQTYIDVHAPAIQNILQQQPLSSGSCRRTFTN
ncbi:MAG: hypothetical protein AABY64_00740 [Bdellovibrionota bacterium]